eukprot:224939-Pyramimonas_sp.AAC.1
MVTHCCPATGRLSSGAPQSWATSSHPLTAPAARGTGPHSGPATPRAGAASSAARGRSRVRGRGRPPAALARRPPADTAPGFPRRSQVRPGTRARYAASILAFATAMGVVTDCWVNEDLPLVATLLEEYFEQLFLGAGS